MHRCVPLLIVAVALTAHAPLHGQFDPEDWPETANEDSLVHFVSTDLSFTPLGDSWSESLQVLTGGDQVTQDIDIGGFSGKKVLGNYLNIADSLYEDWADQEVIDILVQVYGDSAVVNADGNPRNFNFLTGTLPELNFPSGGSIPAECKNREWNWILFRIDNGIRPSDGSRFVGSIPANAQGGTAFAGVNGGTIRFEGVPQLIVRVVAFGEQGAFGEPEDINICLEPLPCPPEPETNLVWVDVNSNTSDHLEILNDGDQTVSIDDEVGPAGDLRRAARPRGIYMNFGISDNYLGEPCNEPQSLKVCIEFYDEPGLLGASIGPEAYATDDLGGVGFVNPQMRHILTGTDTWIRRSWILPDVSLAGVNTGDLTGGPRFISEGGEVYVSAVAIGVLRTGGHPLAGQDPLEDCFADPLICTDAYGNYAEMDLGADPQVLDGLQPGNSGGDQEMIQEEAGPPDDRRMAIRAAHDDGVAAHAHRYLNFALVGEPFGPSSQPNAHLAICATYYDDPELIGHWIRPEVYQSNRGGVVGLAFTGATFDVTLEGTDTWRDAYWEITDMNFSGVNQGPQAAARFATSLGGKIFISRVRYAVIRPCGPEAGVNLLEECKPRLDVLFTRGDANADDQVNITDAVAILEYLFSGGEAPSCLDVADTDDDGSANIADAVSLLGYLFGGDDPPADPFDECGADPTEDELACDSFAPCG